MVLTYFQELFYVRGKGGGWSQKKEKDQSNALWVVWSEGYVSRKEGNF